VRLNKKGDNKVEVEENKIQRDLQLIEMLCKTNFTRQPLMGLFFLSSVQHDECALAKNERLNCLSHLRRGHPGIR
jgi:hypothetical protein